MNFLELLYSGGGRVLSEDGQSVEVNSPEGQAALEFMAEGVESGAAPKAVTTYMEEESRRAFESRQRHLHAQLAVRLRARQGVEDRRPVRHRDLPELRGRRAGQRAGRLQPRHLGLLEEPGGGGRVHRLRHERGGARRRTSWTSASPPALAAVYDDPEVQKKYAFASDLKAAVEQGQARPVSPVYPQITEAIYTNVHDALQGKAEPKAALETMSSDIEKALETF